MLDLFVSDAVIDPVRAGFDVALQIFPPASDELVSRRLFPVRRVFCASPDYLRRYGTPQHPRDLFGHRLGLYSGYPDSRPLGVPSIGRGSRRADHARPEAHADEQLGAPAARLRLRTRRTRCACPRWWRPTRSQQGSCASVLAEFQLSSFWLSAVYPRTQRGAFKPKLFIESLTHAFAGGEPPWDRELIARGLMPERLIEHLSAGLPPTDCSVSVAGII